MLVSCEVKITLDKSITSKSMDLLKPSQGADLCVVHKCWCIIYFKKTLIFAQNLENKGPEIFLPPRSMVLKVVTGKILEILELS